MEGHEHIHVAIGDDLLGGDGGVLSEEAGALEAFLFTGDGDEEDAAFEGFTGLELAGDFEHGGDAGGVIEGTVEDAVAGEGNSFAEVVEMGADDDELVFELGMGAYEFGDYVGAIEFAALDCDGGGEFAWEIELGKRLFGGGEGEEFFGGVAGAGEEHLCLFGIKDEGDLLAGLVGDGGHGSLEAGGGGAGPGNGLDAGDGDESDGSEFAEGLPADIAGLNVGRERTGPAFGSAGEHDDNFAFELEAF